MPTSDDLPTALDHIELGEQLLSQATAAYDNSRQLDLMALTTGRPHDIERRNFVVAEAGMIAQLATAHFTAALSLANVVVSLSPDHDDTQPIDLVPVAESQAMHEPDDLDAVLYRGHAAGIAQLGAVVDVEARLAEIHARNEQEGGPDRG